MYAYIINIMSNHRYRSPWPSPATLLYYLLLPVGLQGHPVSAQSYILSRHRAIACRSSLDVLPLPVHLRGVHWSTPQGFISTFQAVCYAFIYIYIYIIDRKKFNFVVSWWIFFESLQMEKKNSCVFENNLGSYTLLPARRELKNSLLSGSKVNLLK